MKSWKQISAGALIWILAASCANVDKPEKEKKPVDRFAFLHRDQKKPAVSAKESAEAEKVVPKKDKKR